MDLLTEFFYYGKVLKQGRGVSVASDRPNVSGPKRSQAESNRNNAMPFVPVPDVARLAITYQDTSGNQAVNVLHFQDLDGIHSPAHLNLLVQQVAGWLASDWADTAASAWSAIQVEARYLNTEDDFYKIESVNIPGTETGQALPSQDTIAISFRSGLTGRSRRGRLYHVGLSEAAVNGDYLIGTSRTVLIAAYEALMSATATDNWFLVVVSYTGDGQPREFPLVTEITSVVITDDIIDSMDKRKPRP
jgi:hypothetical protein